MEAILLAILLFFKQMVHVFNWVSTYNHPVHIRKASDPAPQSLLRISKETAEEIHDIEASTERPKNNLYKEPRSGIDAILEKGISYLKTEGYTAVFEHIWYKGLFHYDRVLIASASNYYFKNLHSYNLKVINFFKKRLRTSIDESRVVTLLDTHNYDKALEVSYTKSIRYEDWLYTLYQSLANKSDKHPDVQELTSWLEYLRNRSQLWDHWFLKLWQFHRVAHCLEEITNILGHRLPQKREYTLLDPELREILKWKTEYLYGLQCGLFHEVMHEKSMARPLRLIMQMCYVLTKKMGGAIDPPAFEEYLNFVKGKVEAMQEKILTDPLYDFAPMNLQNENDTRLQETKYVRDLPEGTQPLNFKPIDCATAVYMDYFTVLRKHPPDHQYTQQYLEKALRIDELQERIISNIIEKRKNFRDLAPTSPMIHPLFEKLKDLENALQTLEVQRDLLRRVFVKALNDNDTQKTQTWWQRLQASTARKFLRWKIEGTWTDPTPTWHAALHKVDESMKAALDLIKQKRHRVVSLEPSGVIKEHRIETSQRLRSQSMKPSAGRIDFIDLGDDEKH